MIGADVKKKSMAAILAILVFLTLRSDLSIISKENPETVTSYEYHEISGYIRKGETLFDIFKKYKLDVKELFKLREASADIHRLRYLNPDQPYKIILDNYDQINSFKYWINDETILHIMNTEAGFYAEKICIAYERKIVYIEGTIQTNLVSALGKERGGLLLALQLSDIFSWDIDFTTDIRSNDIFRIAVEGLYVDGIFRKYGEIVSAEFVNNSDTFRAYRYEINGEVDYYNEKGKSLRKAFLRAPLSFRRISSTFSKARMHPILKIYRPHHGLDYSAPEGTPVSASGNGIIVFSGYKGQYGKLVTIKHQNGYHTYYGHLSRIPAGINVGTRVEQGQVIGYVGSTGLATGPHLHYEMRINNSPINPLSIKIPKGNAVPEILMASFETFKKEMNDLFAASNFRRYASVIQ